MEKRLTKSRTDKKLCGVCAGIAKYLDVDPTLIRLGAAIFTLFAFAGLIVYIVAAIVMPYDDPAQ